MKGRMELCGVCGYCFEQYVQNGTEEKGKESLEVRTIGCSGS